MWKFKNTLISFLVSAALFSGILWLVLSLFTIEISFVLPVVVGTVIMVSCCYSSALGKKEWIVPAAWLVLTILFAVFFWNKTADGLALLLNEAIDTYKQVHPKNYEIFVANDNTGMSYVIAELTALLAIGCTEAVKHRSAIFRWGVIALVVVAGVVFLPVISTVWLIAAALIILLVFFIGTAYRKQEINIVVRCTLLKTWLRTTAIILLVIAVFSSTLGLEHKPDAIYKLSENTINLVDELRYGSTDHTGLTEGDLSQVGTRQTGTETMLKVTMSQPTSYYLRGFIGEVYENNRWTELPKKTLYDNSDAFGALHQSGFYAQTQIAMAADMLDEEIIQYQNTVQIENVGLPSKYLYAPYELLPWSVALNKSAIGDSSVYADGFAGQREYSLSAANNLIVQYQKIAAMLYQNQDSGGAVDYLKDEAVYNQFVYAQYTELSSDIDSYLAGKLGGFVIDEGQVHFDYQKAKQNILYHLTESITYSEDVSAVENGVDFVLNFLDGTKSGYDVHYATAAVMMFRYYGIPARYAEGYIITKEDVKNAAPGDTLSLDCTHAHAWVEYYQDGVGWLPFEVTPSYLSVMEQADTYKDVSGLVGQAPENEVIDAIQPDTITEEETPLLLSFWLKNKLTILLVFALLALGLLFLLFVSWLVRERRKAAKRKDGFLSENLHLAICSIFEYIIDVSIANGLEPDNRPMEEYTDFFDEDLRGDYQTVVTIWQEAKFSDNEMQEEQRRFVIALKDKIWKRTWEKAGLFRKTQLKFMYFL